MSEMTSSKRIRALIVDDEPIALRGLRQLLAQESHIDIVGECENGREAIIAIRSERPDLVYLDIQMPGVDGFAVLREIGAHAMPCVIFVTAYDQFALDAFAVAATDYVLKPFSPERLLDATTRALKRIRDQRVIAAHEQLLRALNDATVCEVPHSDVVRAPVADYATRLLVSVGARSVVVPLDDVSLIEADGYYVRVSAVASRYTLRESLKDLENRLNPREFLRVHRSAIVRISAVRGMEREDQERLILVLADGTRIPVSRSRREVVIRTLGSIRG